VPSEASAQDTEVLGGKAKLASVSAMRPGACANRPRAYQAAETDCPRRQGLRIRRFPCSASHSLYQQLCWRRESREPPPRTPVDTAVLHDLLHEKIVRHEAEPDD
jgi:hypothetical protein